MKKRILVLSAAATAVMSGLAGQAQAQLLGVVQSFPDTTATGGAYIFYDHDAINSTTGLLRLVSGAAQLAEGAATGGSTTTQSYFAAGDSVPDVLLSIQIRNGTGGFTAGQLVGGTVSIGFGNAAGASRWDWDGTITGLGYQSGTGTILDATWNVTADAYQNMPGNMSQFVTGFLTGRAGGVKIQSSTAWGGPTANFTNDWVYGSNPANNNNINGFRAGMVSPLQFNSTITSDLFVVSQVPEPATTAMLLAGLALLAPLAWARRNKN